MTLPLSSLLNNYQTSLSKDIHNRCNRIIFSAVYNTKHLFLMIGCIPYSDLLTSSLPMTSFSFALVFFSFALLSRHLLVLSLLAYQCQ